LGDPAPNNVLFIVHISSEKGKEFEDEDVLRRYLVFQQLNDVFTKDIIELPPHREVDFSIKLVPGAAPTLKTPYKMRTPMLVELKL